jgi:hypothetical protein
MPANPAALVFFSAVAHACNAERSCADRAALTQLTHCGRHAVLTTAKVHGGLSCSTITHSSTPCLARTRGTTCWGWKLSRSSKGRTQFDQGHLAVVVVEVQRASEEIPTTGADLCCGRRLSGPF